MNTRGKCFLYDCVFSVTLSPLWLSIIVYTDKRAFCVYFFPNSLSLILVYIVVYISFTRVTLQWEPSSSSPPPPSLRELLDTNEFVCVCVCVCARSHKFIVRHKKDFVKWIRRRVGYPLIVPRLPVPSMFSVWAVAARVSRLSEFTDLLRALLLLVY